MSVPNVGTSSAAYPLPQQTGKVQGHGGHHHHHEGGEAPAAATTPSTEDAANPLSALGPTGTALNVTG
jgi:hypothetical protein